MFKDVLENVSRCDKIKIENKNLKWGKMAQTEITVQIFEDIEKVIAKVQSLGYAWKDTFTGKDIYFSTLSLSEVKNASYKDLIDSSVIIREFDKKSTGDHKTMLVHKKKTLDDDGRVVGEVKSSVEIDSSEKAHTLLSNAGLVNWMTLLQQNSFYVSGEKTIIIGTVDGLEGTFVEIEEYDSIKEKSNEEKFKILCEFVKSLGFKLGDDFSCKKIYMLYNKNKKA